MSNKGKLFAKDLENDRQCMVVVNHVRPLLLLLVMAAATVFLHIRIIAATGARILMLDPCRLESMWSRHPRKHCGDFITGERQGRLGGWLLMTDAVAVLWTHNFGWLVRHSFYVFSIAAMVGNQRRWRWWLAQGARIGGGSETYVQYVWNGCRWDFFVRLDFFCPTYQWIAMMKTQLLFCSLWVMKLIGWHVMKEWKLS